MSLEPSANASDELHPLPQATKRLTLDLVQKNCLAPRNSGANTASTTGEYDALLDLETLHLEWMNIGAIENLDLFTKTKELYLQFNQLEQIENLDTLLSLEYLSLANNRIKKVENINHLKKLKLLDLSNNEIEALDAKDLPESVVILSLKGNPIAKDKERLSYLFQELPNLKFLDGRSAVAWEEDDESNDVGLIEASKGEELRSSPEDVGHEEENEKVPVEALLQAAAEEGETLRAKLAQRRTQLISDSRQRSLQFSAPARK